MSAEQLKRFMDELGRDPVMQRSLAAAANDQELIASSIRLAAERGLEVTPAELEAYLRESRAPSGGELSDEQLGAVAGGFGSLTTVSNVTKTQHDTAMSVIRNIG
ncbi:MAG TPA: Nif11-like leader peptide family RiPP precursor [Thermoanaerobaculia bacterium]|nr:Nif11-like leader peptide family RiPP precursor [Thermoanaerobaculia bacterium]